jgi:hypothetical protein
LDINNISLANIIVFFESVAFLKWILLGIILGYIIFMLVVINQLRLMNKLIIQQTSSALLFASGLALLALSVGLGIFVILL